MCRHCRPYLDTNNLLVKGRNTSQEQNVFNQRRNSSCLLFSPPQLSRDDR
jgi:hypothetical protein